MRFQSYFYPRSPCGERQAEQPLPTATIAISIHALLAESDNAANDDEQNTFVFLSTLSLRRATSRYTGGAAAIHNFYPRSPCGERRRLCQRQPRAQAISIHALLAESDIFPSGTAPLVRNFYPRSPCGERPLLSRNTLFDTAISIHALLAESDAFLFGGAQRSGYFYPRSPCGERHCPAVIVRATLEFLSTLSLRRATANSQPLSQVMEHFYPRSPCGERP